MPAAIVDKLHKEIAAIQDLPEIQKQFAAEGAEALRMSPADVRRLHGEGNREMGARRERGKHQGGVRPGETVGSLTVYRYSV